MPLCSAWHEATLLGFSCEPRGPGVTPAAIQFPDVGSTSPTNAVATGKRLHPSREAARLHCSGHPILWMAARAASWVRAGSSCKTGQPQVARTGGAEVPATAWCCRVDTPPASLSNVSASRPTTDPHACSVNLWPMLLLGKLPPAVGPGAFPNPPSTRLGPAAISTEVPVPC
jgi:hypothetical protein